MTALRAWWRRTPPSRHNPMLWLSEILISHHELESFDQLVAVVQEAAKAGEIFFRMDVKPPFQDTPENWEDQLEAAFSAALK
jgi:hypothetical protein